MTPATSSTGQRRHGGGLSRRTALSSLLLAGGAGRPAYAQWDPLRTTAAVNAAEREAADALHLQRARANIEIIRKSSASVQVTDAAGRPLAGARVQVEQTSQDFLFGNLVEDQFQPGWTESDRERFTAMFQGLFNFTELTLAKWDRYEHARGRRQSATLAQQLEWAAARGIRVKGHTLGWSHSAGTPAWLYELPQGQRWPAYQRHLTGIVAEHRGRIPSWDVVNEPVTTVPYGRALAGGPGDGRIDDGPRYDTRGVTLADVLPWVERSFRLAAAADPRAELHINEFNVLSRRDVRQKYFDLVQALLKRGVPVHGIGIQAHEPHSMWFATPEIVKAFDQMATLGLPLHITEFIPQSNGKPITGGWREGTWTQEAQAEFAEQFYTLAFGHPAMKSIHWWGLSDRSVWLPGGGLLDANLNPKPVYERLYQLIQRDWMTRDLSLVADETGLATFRGFHGRYRITVTGPDGRARSVDTRVDEGADNRLLVKL
jgi:endo-1,4-beta-xylanase